MIYSPNEIYKHIGNIRVNTVKNRIFELETHCKMLILIFFKFALRFHLPVTMKPFSKQFNLSSQESMTTTT